MLVQSQHFCHVGMGWLGSAQSLVVLTALLLQCPGIHVMGWQPCLEPNSLPEWGGAGQAYCFPSFSLCLACGSVSAVSSQKPPPPQWMLWMVTASAQTDAYWGHWHSCSRLVSGFPIGHTQEELGMGFVCRRPSVNTVVFWVEYVWTLQVNYCVFTRTRICFVAYPRELSCSPILVILGALRCCSWMCTIQA